MTLSDGDLVRAQYATPTALQTRVSLYDYRVPREDIVELILDLLPPDIDGVVADIGCGPGRYLARLGARRLGSAVGLDVSDGMARAAVEASGAPALVGGAEHLPFATDSVAALLSMHMLYHVDDKRAALCEFRRVTRPGGPVLVLTNDLSHLAEFSQLLEQAGRVRGSLRSPAAMFGLHHDSLVEEVFGAAPIEHIVGEILLDDVQPLVAYADSTRAFYEDRVDGRWDDVMARFAECADERRRAEGGTLHLTTHVGVFTATA